MVAPQEASTEETEFTPFLELRDKQEELLKFVRERAQRGLNDGAWQQAPVSSRYALKYTGEPVPEAAAGTEAGKSEASNGDPASPKDEVDRDALHAARSGTATSLGYSKSF